MRIFLFIIVTLFSALPAAAQDVRALDWDDLLPEGEKERLQTERAAPNVYIPLFGNDVPNADIEGFDHDDPSAYDPRGALAQGGTFKVVEELDGQRVSLPGFVVPLDFTDRNRISSFLLVPYFGACIHFPPPPPNQIVYVVADKPLKMGRLSQAYRVTGVLSTERSYNELGNAAYTLSLTSWEELD